VCASAARSRLPAGGGAWGPRPGPTPRAALSGGGGGGSPPLPKSGGPPRRRRGPPEGAVVTAARPPVGPPVVGSPRGVRGGQVGDEWVQHRGGQPGWAARRPLLRPELLPHRRRGPLRAPRRQRVLQQEDPEEHLAEEAEAGHRQKCETSVYL
ncbi:hypothetical protein Nmel_013965, partial [Mimus melanotis]